jgi:hypothetical protein
VSFGQPELEQMLAIGHLEMCPLDRAGAAALIDKARTQHASAGLLAASDPETAIVALRSGNRKALDAVLLARGLRPTKAGGHISSLEAVRATLGGGRLAVLGVYDVVRRIRHEGDYQNAAYDVHEDDVRDNLSDSSALVDACERALDTVPPFVRGRR